jgi:hypothetical protein
VVICDTDIPERLSKVMMVTFVSSIFALWLFHLCICGNNTFIWSLWLTIRISLIDGCW